MFPELLLRLHLMFLTNKAEVENRMQMIPQDKTWAMMK